MGSALRLMFGMGIFVMLIVYVAIGYSIDKEYSTQIADVQKDVIALKSKENTLLATRSELETLRQTLELEIDTVKRREAQDRAREAELAEQQKEKDAEKLAEEEQAQLAQQQTSQKLAEKQRLAQQQKLAEQQRLYDEQLAAQRAAEIASKTKTPVTTRAS